MLLNSSWLVLPALVVTQKASECPVSEVLWQPGRLSPDTRGMPGTVQSISRIVTYPHVDTRMGIIILPIL